MKIHLKKDPLGGASASEIFAIFTEDDRLKCFGEGLRGQGSEVGLLRVKGSNMVEFGEMILRLVRQLSCSC